MESMYYIAGGFAVLSTLFYVYKFIKRLDFGYILMILSRLYLVFVWIKHFILDEHIGHEDFLLVIAVLMICEVCNSIVYLSSRKFIVKIEENKVKEKIIKESDLCYSAQKVGFFITSEEGYIKYSNKALLTILDYTKQELVQKNILDIVFPEDVETVREEIRLKLLGEKQISIYDFRIVTKEGKVKNVRVISSVITNGHTNIAGSLFLKED